MGDGMAAEGGGGGVAGKAVWEQRKWEKQDSLEGWAREGSPATAGPEAGWRAGGRGSRRMQGKAGEAREAQLWGRQPTDSRDPPVAASESREKRRLLGSPIPGFQGQAG